MTGTLDMRLVELYAEGLRQQETARATSNLYGRDLSPDLASEAEQIGGRLGIPAGMVLGDIDIYRQQDALQRASDTLGQSPALRAWLDTDPLNAHYASDELPTLAEWEDFYRGQTPEPLIDRDAWRDPEGNVEELFQDPMIRGVTSGLLGLSSFGQSLTSLPETGAYRDNTRLLELYEQAIALGTEPDPVTALGLNPMSVEASFLQGFLDASEDDRQAIINATVEAISRDEGFIAAMEEQMAAFTQRQSELNGDIPNWRDIRTIGEFYEFAAYNIGQSLPYMGVVAAAGAINPALGYAAGQALGAGDIQREIIEQGAARNATNAPFIYSAPYAAMELLGPVGRAFRGVTPAVLREGARRYFLATGRELTENFVEEFINEAGQAIITSYAAQAGGGEEVVLNDETFAAWIDEGVAGGFGGIGVSGGSMAVNATIDRLGTVPSIDLSRLQNSGQTAAHLEQVDEMSLRTALRERSPDRMADLLSGAGGDRDLYVPADELRVYAQSANLDLEQLGVDMVELETMAESGGMVAIPEAQYAARISGTDAAQWFRENAVLNPDTEMSLAEQARIGRDLMDEAMETARRMREEGETLRASDQQVYDSWRAQLREAGRAPDVADQEATLFAAFFRTMGERYGADPLDLYKRFGVRIERATGEQAATDGQTLQQVRTLPQQMAQQSVPQESVVRGQDGSPLLVRHGTTQEFDAPAAFTQFTPNEMISDEFGPRQGGRVIEAYLDIRNPADLREMNISPSDPNIRAILEDLQSQGYDGAFYRDDMWTPFSEEQIIPAEQAPTSDPRVLFQGPRFTPRERLLERGPLRQPRGNTYMGVGPQYTVENNNADAPVLQRNAPLIQASSNAGNADVQSEALDALFEKHPNPLASEQAWIDLANDAFSLDRVPMPPFRTIEIVQQGPQLVAEEIGRLSDGMRRDAEAGLQTAREFGELYARGEATPDITAKAFMWSFLSRGVSPYVQEAAFLDAIVSDELTSIMQRAAADGWSDGLQAEYEAWAANAIPPGSPGRGTQHNLNAFGRNFMRVMTQRHENAGGRTGLEIIHDMIADGTPSKDIRRAFLKYGSSAGIDNKVVSFTLLLLGRSDVLVLDRVQVRNQFNDGRFDGQNIYDSDIDENKKQVTGSAFAEMTFGHKGLLYYEAMEAALAPIIEEAYASMGMEGSLGRYHWDSWLLASNQEVGHASVEGLLRDAQGRETPYAGAFVRQGKYIQYDYGFRYGVLPDGALSTLVEWLDGNGATLIGYEAMADAKSPLRKTLDKLKTKARKRGKEYGTTQPWTAGLTPEERAQYDAAIESAGTPAPNLWAYDPNAVGRAGDAALYVDAGGDARSGDTGEPAPSGDVVRQPGGSEGGSGAAIGDPQPVDGATFSAVMEEAGPLIGPLAAQVSTVDPSRDVQRFLLDGGMTGYALDGDNIIGVFKHPDAPGGAAQRVLEDAVARGGRRLDGFNTMLPKAYAKGGFRAVARLAFDPEYAPARPDALADWDVEAMEAMRPGWGAPDVFFMVYDPANANADTDNVVDSYEDGIVAQDDALAEIDARPQAPRVLTQSATDSPAFREWFGDSKVVDENGDPLVVYHGTTADFSSFNGPAYFSTDPSEGSAYTFADTVARRDRALSNPKYTAVEAGAVDAALPYIGIMSDIPQDQIGVWWATDNGVARRREGGRFDVATDLVVDYETGLVDGDRIAVAPGDGAGNAQSLIEEQAAAVDRMLPPGEGEGGNVIAVYLSIQNPIEMPATEANQLGQRLEQMTPEEVAAFVDDLKAQGYDGIKTVSDDIAYVFNDEQRPVQYIAFDPEQIKSVNNVGTFDRNDPNILRQDDGSDAPRGQISIPAGGVEGGTTVIKLFDGADLSTVLHESGHYFYEVFSTLAADERAPQAMKDDFAALQAWMGVEEGKPPSREALETFARGIERYTLEGKAPSVELAPVFQRFKAWLLRVYQTVKQRRLNVKLTPEVREVFDRMLATDAEIKQARDLAGDSALLKSAPPGMSEASWAAYQRLQRQKVERANETLMERAMAAVRRRTERWWREERDSRIQQEMDRLGQEAAYRAIRALADGDWEGIDGAVEGADLRLDRAALEEMFGPDITNQIPPAKYGMSRAIYTTAKHPDGMHPSEAAEVLGFASAAEMMDALLEAGNRRAIAEATVDRAMAEQYGDPFSDGSIEAEALEAVHNDRKGEAMALELRYIAERLGRDGRREQTATFKARARAIIGGLSVQQATKPGHFLQAERQASRRAQEAFAAGRLEEAYQAKQQEALNHYLFVEASRLEKLVARKREQMRNYDRADVRKKVGPREMEQIDAILQDYEFRQRSQRAIDRGLSLRQYIEQMTQEGREAELMIDADLMDEVRRQHYSRLTVDDLMTVFDAVDNLDALGRTKSEIRNGLDKIKLRKAAATVARQIRDNFGTGRRGKESRLRSTMNLLWTADTILTEMDGTVEYGEAYRLIKEALDAGQSREQQMHVELAERLEELFSVYSQEDLAEMRKERHVNGANARAWSKLEIISLALNMGNADNIQRVLSEDINKDFRLNRDQVDALLDTLDKRDWDFVQSMWDQIDSYWPEIEAVTTRRTGVKPRKVEAVPVQTRFGVYRGGYYPIAYDPSSSGRSSVDAVTATDQFMSAGRYGKAQTAHGHTISRKQNSNGRALLFDMNVAFRHMRDVVRDIALSEAVDGAYRILNDEEVHSAFIEAGRENDFRVLNLWLKDLARGPIYNTDSLNTAARFIKNNFTLSRLAFNLKTAILQITGIGQSAATVGKRAMAQGFAEYLKRPQELAQEVIAMSPFMAERQNTFQKDIYDFANDVKLSSPLASRWSKTKNRVSQWGFAPMMWTQFYAVDMPTWVAGYRVGLERFGNEEQAVRFADRMVARSQDSGLFGDRSAMSRGTMSETTRQSDFIRLFTTLAGYMMTKLNRANLTVRRGVKGMREGATIEAQAAAAANMAADLVLLYVTEAAMMALMYAVFADDDDELNPAAFFGREISAAVFGGLPFVRDAAAAFTGYGGGGVYGSVGELPYRVWQQTVNQDWENDAALRRAIGDLVGTTTGLPTTASLRLIEGIVDEDDRPFIEALVGRNQLAR